MIDIASATLNLYAGGVLAGPVTGAGTLQLGGGVFTLLSGFSHSGGLTVNSTISLGGTVTNLAGPATLSRATIQGPGTLATTGGVTVNTAFLTGGATWSNAGTVTLASRYISGGAFVNQAGAELDLAVSGKGFFGSTLSNVGTLVTNNGIYLYAGVSGNSGTIIAPSSNAVVIRAGTFVNQASIIGSGYGIQLGSTVTITGTSTVSSGGMVTTSGNVTGRVGVGVMPGSTASQTVSVSGLVAGTSGTAVALTTGGSDRLILHAGASFQGKVRGGGGKSVVEVSAATGVLGVGEGAAAAAVYVSLGSVSNFSALQVDPGATTNAGGSISFDTLVNQGQINLLAGDSLVVGTVAGAAAGGTIDLKSGGSVHFTGAVAASQTVLFRPPGGSVVLDHPEQFAASVTEFAATDTLDLPLGKASFQQYAGGVLSLNYGGASVALHLATIYATPQFQLTDDGHGGTDIFVSAAPCFCRGTRILTARGEVAIEDVRVGERVVTLSGELKPIRWIGMGRDLVTRANRLARPIIVCRDALAENVPHRDLYLTHGHALYLDSVLIPVEHLVNHRTILWDERSQVVEYYHIELDDHDVLLAEGAPAESYHDAGNRAAFQNMRPGSIAPQPRPTFAPVLHGGEVVEAVWARLLARAGGPAAGAVTADPDLHLVIDGERLESESSAGGVHRFVVPRRPVARLLLRSRVGVPSLLGQGRSNHRPLGVAITQLILEQAGIATYLDYDQPQLREAGCYRHEDGFAWTDGDLQLPARFLPPLARPFTLVVRTEPHPDMRYPLAPMSAMALPASLDHAPPVGARPKLTARTPPARKAR